MNIIHVELSPEVLVKLQIMQKIAIKTALPINNIYNSERILTSLQFFTFPNFI